MKRILSLFLATTLLPLAIAQGEKRVKTFDHDSAWSIVTDGIKTDLGPGEWSTEQDGSYNIEGYQEPFGQPNHPPKPMWYDAGIDGGWLQPIGTETPDINRGPVGEGNIGGFNPDAIAAQYTGVIIWDYEIWGDVSTATHVTMEVKGSFAGSGGIHVFVSHDEDIKVYGEPGEIGGFWSIGAAASDVAVGAMPGDVTEWTEVLIPINRPATEADKIWNGNWGGGADLSEWDDTFSDVNRISLYGLTPDSQVDNLGFILPDVGLPGDLDEDDDVDGNDFLSWQANNGSPAGLQLWQDNFGTIGASTAASLVVVPEPSTALLAIAGLLALLGARRIPFSPAP